MTESFLAHLDSRQWQVVIDPQRRTVDIGGRQVLLTPQEFDLLEYLARRAGVAVSRRELSAALGDSHTVASRTVDTYIASIRAKAGLVELLSTVRGVGYRLNSKGLSGFSSFVVVIDEE